MTATKPNPPTHRLYTVKGEKNAKWLEMGAAWKNRKGQGYTLQLDAVPLGGRIVMREITERETAGGQS